MSTMTSGGWLTAKKRGRDDDEIERDRQAALKARQQRRGINKPKLTQTKLNLVKKAKKKNDDYDDLDGFIVDDDVSSDKEEKEKRVTMTKQRPPPRFTYTSDDDDEEIDTPKTGRKPKRPSAMYSDDEEEEEFVDDESDDDEEEETFLNPTTAKRTSQQSRFFARTNRKKPPVVSLPTSDSSRDGSDDEQEMPRRRQQAQPAMKKQQEIMDLMSSDDECVTKKPAKKLIALDDDVPPQPAVVSTDSSTKTTFCFDNDSVKVMKTTAAKFSVFDDGDDDSVQVVATKKKNKKPKRLVINDEDDFFDDELAMGIAMSESLAMEEEPDVRDEVLLDDDDDDNDDESVPHNDDNQDKRAAALAILASANRLSAQVLAHLTEWSGDAGMIVSEVDETSPLETTHAWISHQALEQVCKIKLADYQLIGVNWLQLLHGLKLSLPDGTSHNVNGILADVMGLGKTVQTIAYLAYLQQKQQSRKKPHIIIVPASVLDNWMAEFDKVAPQLQIVKYHGSMAERSDLQQSLLQTLPRRNSAAAIDCDIDVVLTTFSYFSGSKTDDRAFLRRFDYHYMVVDEAHCLKNPDANVYQNLDKLGTEHRILLTGTPVQNSPKELMSLICFLMPLFKPTGAEWDDEDTKKNDGGARMLEYFVSLEGGKSDEEAYRKLKQLFAPFVLRRRKEDVLSQALPPKTREVVHVLLNSEMRIMYDSILASHLKGKGKNKKAIEGNASDRQHLFTALRKTANHPLLLRNRHTSEEEIDHLANHLRMYGYFGHDTSLTVNLIKRQLEKMSDFDIHHAALDVIDENRRRQQEMAKYILDEKDLFCSPKLEKLRTLIPDLIEKGHRILIFSQWTNCLDLLGCLAESLSLSFLRLDGQTPIKERQEMINTFNKDSNIPIFLLSTKAGGMGINLTAADVCILHDLDFNPFNDLQAEDRCHRIGQTKPVKVIKMVTKDTVDDDIYEMQQRKTKMNAAILEKGGSIDAAKEKNWDNAEIKSILQNQLERYLSKQNDNQKEDTMTI